MELNPGPVSLTHFVCAERRRVCFRGRGWNTWTTRIPSSSSASTYRSPQVGYLSWRTLMRMRFSMRITVVNMIISQGMALSEISRDFIGCRSDLMQPQTSNMGLLSPGEPPRRCASQRKGYVPSGVRTRAVQYYSLRRGLSACTATTTSWRPHQCASCGRSCRT